MRQLLRVVLSSTFAATIALGGLTGAVAAAPMSGNGISFELYEEMCLDDGSLILCFEVHGRSTIVTWNEGDQLVTTAVRTRSFVVEHGIVSSASIDHGVYQTKLVDGVFADELTITFNRSLTPGQQCVAHLLLKVEDGAVVVDQASASCN